MRRRSAIAAIALTVAGLAPASIASAVPSDQAATLWQHVCEDAAKGTLQATFSCIHTGFPIWSDAATRLLRHTCEDALGGTFVRRSEYPTEYAICFLD